MRAGAIQLNLLNWEAERHPTAWWAWFAVCPRVVAYRGWERLGDFVSIKGVKRVAVAMAAVAVLTTTLVTAEFSGPEPAAALDMAETAAASATSASEPGLERAVALTGSSFNPGLIISDALFFDSNAMTLAQIQAFLVAKVGACSNSYCLANYRTSSASKAGDSWCSAISGSSSESAASIIFRVQQACGISARAILVTLQKEQGLITQRAPSAGAIRIAMGYGCPDTAACDSTYYGFFNQIYQAARQFKRYGQPGTGLTWYPLGQTTAVRYHPNSACGSKPVLIQNRATAALYYYTPYTPNSAALANLYGTGDGCSSYGNRNFWRFFNEWFGNSLAGAGDAAIAAVYNEKKGSLGAPTAPVVSCGNQLSCYQRYEHGAIYWMASAAAVALTGAYWTEFAEQNYGSGTLGFPLADPVSVDGGAGLPFQFGTIYSSPAGTFSVLKPLRNTYWANGSNAGALGWPTGDQDCAGGICSQPFQGGIVFSSGAAGAVLSDDDFVDAFERAGGVATMGMPAGAKVSITNSPHGQATGQTFTNGTIFSSGAGTFGVAGAIKSKYSALRSYLGEVGWPVDDMACASQSCSQPFQNGAIFNSTATGAKFVDSTYLDAWEEAGGAPVMGLPMIDRVVVLNARNGNGAGQTFQNGTIYSSASGTFAVVLPLRDVYFAKGGNAGSYGWPIAAQTCSSSTCSQRFQHGTLTNDNPDDNVVYRYWLESGGAYGPLGSPVRDVVSMTENGGGIGQTFTKGTVLSSAAGTFAVLLPLRTEYSAHGWPTAEQKCDAGECVQTFQGGTVFSSTTRGGRTVVGEFNTIYAAGDGALGLPLADQIDIPAGPNGAGTGQSFSNGTIYKGSPGAFAVLRPARDAYSAAGSYNGALGWPISAQACDGEDCHQEFQGGYIFSSAGGTRVVAGAYADAYRAMGGFAVLGGARSDVLAVTTSANGNGSGQIFAGGAIYSSAAGTFGMTSAVRAEYLALGSNAGSMGWPTSTRNCGADDCSQNFQGGMIFESRTIGVRSLAGSYFVEFSRAGGLTTLGEPRSQVINVVGNSNGDGSGQAFVNGTIYASAAGTFAVMKPLRDDYFAAGGNAGSYGWPTAPQTCSAGVCSQQFQGGTITR